MTPRTALVPATLLGATALLLTGCTAAPSGADRADDRPDATAPDGARIVVTYDGGLLTLDQDLRVVADDRSTASPASTRPGTAGTCSSPSRPASACSTRLLIRP